MDKIFTKILFFFLLFNLAGVTAVLAQTITAGNVDPGPYGQGSTISAPFHITSSCITSASNTFNVYLSDAAGSFAAKKLIGSTTGFYAGFVNGLIPAGTPAGAGYRVRVESTTPLIIGTASAAFVISPLQGTTAGAVSQAVNGANPEVFGACLGIDNQAYSFQNTSKSGAVPVVATANFYNELAQADEGTFALDKTFNANEANYTVTVRAQNIAGVVGTKAYLLMNNVINNSFGASGSTTVCLSGGNSLTYNVDVTSANGIQNNYPGLTYLVKWGDGATSTLTLCEIQAAGGEISHVYTRSSCGNVVNGQRNVFEVDLQPISPFCGQVVTQVTGYAKVVTPPINQFVLPASGCRGTAVTINNTSVPGQDPNSGSTTCNNTTGLYTWLVNGVVVEINDPITKPFVHTFATVGSYTVTLRLQNSGTLCPTPDVTKTICIKDPPTSSFTLPATTVCTGSVLTPANTSVNPAVCVADPYRWTVTGPAPVSYTGSTDASSVTPQFVFNTAGIYQVRLDILAQGCGTISSTTQAVEVNSSPVASLSPDVALCGSGRTFTFDTNPGVTRSILAGTQVTLPTTYVWTVSAAAGGTYSFVNGTNANSRFPQITFNNYDTYTVTITHTNGCGSATDSQVITFQPAPVVSAGPDQTICEGAQAALAGTVTGAFTTRQWIGGTGVFAPDRNTPNAIYTPSAAEIAAGQAILTFSVTTAVPAPCDKIDDDVIIAITKKGIINSASSQTVCNGQNFRYNITSANPATTFSWTTSLTSGSATGFGANGSGPVINDLINNNNPTTDAVVNYAITPTTNGCAGAVFNLTVSIKALPLITVNVANPVICSNQLAGITFNSNQAATTYTWTSVASAGISGNSSQGIPTGNGSIQDVLINNSTTAGTVTYTITPLNSTCASNSTTATVIVQPLPVTAIPGPDAQICNSPTYKLQGNNPAPGTGKWTVISAQTGVTFSDDTNPTATVSGLLPGNLYQFKWSITASPTCPPSSAVVSITDAAQTVGGTIAGSTTVCFGNNAGALNLSGQTGNVIRWEYSNDNGTTWLIIANSTATLNYLNLSQTTQYRAVVQNSICSIQTSAIATINVNAQTVLANAGIDNSTCNVSVITLTGNDPAPFAGMWTQTGGPPVTIVNPTNSTTQVTGLTGGNTYKFTWTIKGLPPCTDSSDELVITNTNDVTASFTANKITGCGPVTVNFTNTSSVIAGTLFAWDFGDGSPQSTLVNPTHVFQSRPDGKEAVYTVSLNVTNNCVPRPPVTQTISVSPAVPVATILPDDLNGCGNFVLNVQNASPGTNTQYDFYLYDGAVLRQHIVKTDKSAATFNAISVAAVKTFDLYMIVADKCGTTAKSTTVPITISPASFTPQMFIKNSLSKGCAPFNVTFVNNSTGGNTFVYNIYNASNTLIETVPGSKSDLPYTFNTPGTYFVSISGTDFCTTLESAPKLRVDVFTTPLPDFDADIKTGCNNFSVNFANLTPKDGTTPASSLQYDWDFGDGKHSSAFNPPSHIYRFSNSPYTVTLTVTNLSSGCSNNIVKSDFIIVNSPPLTNFTAKPDTITTIPNYHFDFVDKTTGNLVSWRWKFGDGASSSSQNPGHTYADTGTYKVTLTVINQLGCDSTISHNVKIGGVPGQLYLPNAFTPDGLSSELKTFTVKGSGIAKYSLQIFDNWGQLIWQTTRLSNKGEPTEAWDGTFKGSPAPQGVYVWQASATFINGTEWKGMSYNNSLPKRTGVIHLIR